MGDVRFVACYVIKIQNKLFWKGMYMYMYVCMYVCKTLFKHGKILHNSLLQVATVTGIRTNCLENFQRLEVMEGNFSRNFSNGERELVGVCGSFEKMRVREIGGKI